MTALVLSDKLKFVASCSSAKPDGDKPSPASNDRLRLVGD